MRRDVRWGSHDLEELSMQMITTIEVDIAKSVFRFTAWTPRDRL